LCKVKCTKLHTKRTSSRPTGKNPKPSSDKFSGRSFAGFEMSQLVKATQRKQITTNDNQILTKLNSVYSALSLATGAIDGGEISPRRVKGVGREREGYNHEEELREK
jgi:hypothetical protein